MRPIAGRPGVVLGSGARTESTSTFLAPEPFVQIRDTKAPELADVASLDLASASLLLKSFGMNAKKRGSFVRVQQGLKFSHIEPTLTGHLNRTWWERICHTTSDGEIMAAFSSGVQDLLRQH
jgi:hypothetical protein